MDRKKFELILSVIASHVVRLIIEKTGRPEDEVITEFMKSRVYECLQDEETKVWHLSAWKLASLYEDELDGRLEWPCVP